MGVVGLFETAVADVDRATWPLQFSSVVLSGVPRHTHTHTYTHLRRSASKSVSSWLQLADLSSMLLVGRTDSDLAPGTDARHGRRHVAMMRNTYLDDPDGLAPEFHVPPSPSRSRSRILPRDIMLARVLAVVLCLCVFVSVSVTRRYCIEMAARIELISAYRFRSTYDMLYFREIRISSKISVRCNRSGTFLQILDLEDVATTHRPSANVI